jgi:hypothetical protein
MDEDKNISSVNFIRNTITSLNGELHVEWNKPDGLNYIFYIHDHNIQIKFGCDVMEDFNVACQGNKKSDNYRALDNLIRFRIYIALGNAGLIPKFLVSRSLLDEERDWLINFKTHFQGTDKLNNCFYNGLKELSSFLGEISKKYGLSEEMQEELRRIRNLLDHYEKEHDFEEDEASEKSLCFLKAAAVCMIIYNEREKKSITIPRILKGKDEEIYSIVAALRENPFPQIKMPDCIYDYAEYVKVEKNDSESEKLPAKELVFVACGQSTEEEKALGVQVKDLLKRHNIDSFLAETANDLESLNSHIFRNLSDCTGFIAILHKRDKGRYDTSVWINQEVGIAAYLRSTGREIPSFVLYEESAIIEGLIKYTIANPPTFKSDEEVLSKIEEWIKRQNFAYREKLPELDIILSEERRQFGSSSGSERKGYFEIGYALSFRIRNKSNVTICLEDVRAENVLLGMGKLDKTNLRLSKVPFNVESRRTEELHLFIKFPNEVDVDMKDKEIKLKVEFEFADRVLTKELIGYL